MDQEFFFVAVMTTFLADINGSNIASSCTQWSAKEHFLVNHVCYYSRVMSYSSLRYTTFDHIKWHSPPRMLGPAVAYRIQPLSSNILNHFEHPPKIYRSLEFQYLTVTLPSHNSRQMLNQLCIWCFSVRYVSVPANVRKLSFRSLLDRHVPLNYRNSGQSAVPHTPLDYDTIFPWLHSSNGTGCGFLKKNSVERNCNSNQNSRVNGSIADHCVHTFRSSSCNNIPRCLKISLHCNWEKRPVKLLLSHHMDAIRRFRSWSFLCSHLVCQNIRIFAGRRKMKRSFRRLTVAAYAKQRIYLLWEDCPHQLLSSILCSNGLDGAIVECPHDLRTCMLFVVGVHRLF